MLKPGIAMRHPFTVEGPLLTDVGGTLGFSVLSTPGMAAMRTHERRIVQRG